MQRFSVRAARLDTHVKKFPLTVALARQPSYSESMNTSMSRHDPVDPATRAQLLSVKIPIIYDLAEAARILGLSESYLRSKLRDRTFAGMKRAGRWAMTEAQIEGAIESMCIQARPADPPSPSGLSRQSRYGRRLHQQRGA